MHLSGVTEACPTEALASSEMGRPVADRRTVEELSALYHDEYHRFVRFAEAVTRDPEEARDAVQEGFANALRELDRFGGRGSFEGWVWRCVLNAARMGRRRRSLGRVLARAERPLRQASETVEPEPKLLNQIARLPERQRLVLFLRYFADLSYDGIAEALEVAPGTVAATLHAAHNALRQRLEEAEDE